MKKSMITFLTLFCTLNFLCGCSTTKVKRVDVKEIIDLNGRWNDTDSRLVSEELIRDVLNRPWIPKFQGKNSRLPVIIVGEITNKSHEHINAAVFTKDLELHLLNSGKIKFVASKNERIQVRGERDEQHKGFTNPETIKAIGRETGADFILIGSINSIKETDKSRYVILYQINLELIDIENNEKVWIGQKAIKKLVKRSKYSL